MGLTIPADPEQDGSAIPKTRRNSLSPRYAEWLRLALALAAACAATFCAGRAAPAATKPVELHIDYLPNLIYDGERLMLCAAAVNRTSALVKAQVYSSLTVGARELGSSTTRDVAIPAGREVRFEAGWEVDELTESATLNIVLTVGQEDVDARRITVHPASLALPQLKLGDGFLADESGERVVLVVRRQLRERASRWGVVKWVQSAVSGGKVTASSGLFIGDRLARTEKDSYASLLKADPVLGRFTFLTVAHPGGTAQAASPVLETLCEVSRFAFKQRYDLAVVFLGSEEAGFGTDVEEFRRAVDLMAGVLKSRGCAHLAFACPVAPENLAGGIERYRRAVMSVVYAAGALHLDPQPAVVRAGWGRGRVPAPPCSRALADEIIRFINAVTVQ